MLDGLFLAEISKPEEQDQRGDNGNTPPDGDPFHEPGTFFFGYAVGCIQESAHATSLLFDLYFTGYALSYAATASAVISTDGLNATALAMSMITSRPLSSIIFLTTSCMRV